MSFRVEIPCLDCLGCYNTVELDTKNLERGYASFKCTMCGKISIVPLSQCRIIDIDSYNRTMVEFNRLKKLKKTYR